MRIASGGDAGQVEHDLHGLLGLEHVDDGHALAGDDVPPIRPAPGQIIEQPMDVLRTNQPADPSIPTENAAISRFYRRSQSQLVPGTDR